MCNQDNVFYVDINSFLGTISVTIATMSKTDKSHTSEVYVVGFVRTYLLLKKRAISLDSFLSPLCDEIVDGFIDGKFELCLKISANGSCSYAL